MDQSLEELRAQRELIRKHLEWIDRQLAAAETGKPSEPTSETTSPSEAPETPKASPVKTAPPAEATEGTAAPEGSKVFVNDDPERLHAPAPVDLTRAKIGCLALFFLSSFLFLFLLFGLPYLMD
ncbi:MAG: hypothetical protein ACSHX4_05235 [Opitutaceae bacterium]